MGISCSRILRNEQKVATGTQAREFSSCRSRAEHDVTASSPACALAVVRYGCPLPKFRKEGHRRLPNLGFARRSRLDYDTVSAIQARSRGTSVAQFAAQTGESFWTDTPRQVSTMNRRSTDAGVQTRRSATAFGAETAVDPVVAFRTSTDVVAECIPQTNS